MLLKIALGAAAWLAVMFLLCRLMRFADQRGDGPPPPVSDPHPITGVDIALAVAVFVAAIAASAAWPLGFAS